MRGPMQLRPRAVLTVLTVVVLGGTGCQAPLQAKSQRSQSSGDSPSTTSSTPRVPPPPPLSPSPRLSPSPPLPPSLVFPELKIPPRRTGPVLGADISWPQCPKGMGIAQKPTQGSPMPIAAARFVIIGLTNGPGFYPNPCLADQVAWVQQRQLLAAAYSVVSTPRQGDLETYGGKGPYDGGTRLGALSNVGYQQSRFNLRTMRSAGLQSPIIWLDVEPVPGFDWPADPTANAAVVRGAARGYTDAGFRVGAYSTQALWQGVVGDLVLDIAEWRAAGQTSRTEALARCGPDRMFNGGRAVLSQWVEAGRDQNVTCPGTSAEMSRWFRQY